MPGRNISYRQLLMELLLIHLSCASHSLLCIIICYAIWACISFWCTAWGIFTCQCTIIIIPVHFRKTSSHLWRWHRSTCRRSEEHTSELQSHHDLVCRLLLEKNFFNDTATTEIYTLSLHDALPIFIYHCIPAGVVRRFFCMSWINYPILFR